jgi:iron complex outermembrane receptor protein
MPRITLIVVGAAAWIAALVSVPWGSGAAESGNVAATDTPSVGASDSHAGLDEVVVTARRRAENEQDVPIPITALNGTALDQSGVNRLEDLNDRMPSLNVEFGNPRQTSIAVRGLGNNPANDGLESSVGIYLDDVYLGRPGMANQDLIDLEQVSLLRGPQGTLFGKNTTAGVVNLSTSAPSFTPGGAIETSAGNYGYYQVRGTATGPIDDDMLAVLFVREFPRAPGQAAYRAGASSRQSPAFVNANFFDDTLIGRRSRQTGDGSN